MSYYYKNSVRAIFMIIGIYYHTAIRYSTNIILRVSDEYTNVIHSRMNQFYIIGGSFTAFLIKKNGTIYFLFNGKYK